MTLSGQPQPQPPEPDLPPASGLVDKADVDHMNAVPAELRGLQQWVVWRYEVRSGRPTKVPYCPLAGEGEVRRASATDPATWGSFEAALRARRSGGYAGVGVVLTSSDPYVGIDLDRCIEPHTGEPLGCAQDIIAALDSYTELTPSGQGVHIFVRGALPPWGRKRGGVEMYSERRYFTVTGRCLDFTPPTIESREEELTALHARVFGNSADDGRRVLSLRRMDDETVLRLASGASNGEKFRALWSSDTGDYPSASEADAGLCAILGFYTQDPAQIERLFNRSALNRGKWSERPDYRERTIRLGLGGLRETYTRPVANGEAHSRQSQI